MMVGIMRRAATWCAIFSLVSAATVTARVADAGAAGTMAPGWSISAVAMPTLFSSADAASCSATERCDKYTIIVTNTGGATSSGPVTITDKLPEKGVSFFGYHARDLRTSAPIGCTNLALTVECVDNTPIPPYNSVLVDIEVLVEPGNEANLANGAEVSGAGSEIATTAVHNVANASTTTPAFGIADFRLNAYGSDGRVDERAGDRPHTLTSSFDFNNVLTPGVDFSSYLAAEEAKTITVELPVGLIGYPLSTPEKCPEADLATKPPGAPPGFASSCPVRSRVGVVVLNREANIESSESNGSVSGLYNMVPEKGYPVVFGFRFISAPVLLYARVVPTPSGYRVRVTAPNLPHAAGSYKVIGSILSFFGVPNAANRLVGAEAIAAFRNPTSCTESPGLLSARMEVTSWVKPGRRIVSEAPVYGGLTGCNLLQFDPQLQAQPQMMQTDTPSGYEIDLKVPQPGMFEEQATPDLKSASVTLPRGVALSPPAASGLLGCSEAQIDPMGTELGEGHPGGNGSPYDDGLEHASPGHCPEASKIGKVEVKTPLLSEPLKGNVYVAQPTCGGEGQPPCTAASASNGELYGLYLEISGSGVIIKLHGKVSADPQTGQLTTTFSENPQLPFEELKLTLDSGPRAPLANPKTCGTFAVTGEMEPWSAPESGPNAKPASVFGVGGCSNPMAFVPGFVAGVTSPVADGFSPFAVTISRKDGEQDIGGVSVTLPPGLSGMTATLPRCDEAAANAGTCPASTRIGIAHVAAGSGTEPLWLEGPVYFTGPYHGAPFGLSVVVPIKVGPFNLGNEVVRSAITVDPHTAQATTTTEPLRLIRYGAPFRLKTINVVVDRPEFIFNPTNCGQEQVTGSITGDLPDGTPGSTAAVSTPFAVVGCKSLPFHPSFQVSTEGRTSKANGASLDVKVSNTAGSANIHEAHVSLPKQLPSRLDTLKLACVDRVFEANPASCPAASAVGTATAMTPILAHPVSGPAYLVSHGGAEFPDLEIVLQGEGVTLVLDGKTDIKKNITTSTFSTVPDAPVSSFELRLPEGAHSVLGAPGGKLCTEDLVMPTTLRGQNGAVVDQSTKIAVTGCKPAIVVLRHSVKNGVATITASVPFAGTLTATASGLSRSVKRTGKAGRVTLELKLNQSERNFLSKHPGRRLRARVRLHFTPQRGKALSAGVTLLIG